LGYRFLNSDRSWMFGVNAGYDSRPMATGGTDTGVNVSNSSTVFYQQVAAGLEAVSNTWNFNAYALVPVGTKEYRLNSYYFGGALDTYGLDVGYSITPDFKASVGYYYQDGDFNTADGSGVLGRLAYNISNGLTAGVNLSYDQAYETRFSADLKYRFGVNGNKIASEKKAGQTPVMQALTDSVKHRDVKIHDVFWEDIVSIIAPGAWIVMQELNSVVGTGVGSFLNPVDAAQYLMACAVVGPFLCNGGVSIADPFSAGNRNPNGGWGGRLPDPGEL